MSITRSLLSALSPGLGHVRRGAAVAVCGAVIAIGVASSPASAMYGTADVPVGSYPIGVAVDPATDQIYVTNNGSNSVSVISGGTDTVIETVAVGSSPYGVAFNPTVDRVYVANTKDDTVSVIDAYEHEIFATVPVGSGPMGVAVDPGTNTIYAANAVGNSVSVIDGYTDKVTATVPVGTYPQGIAVDPDTHTIYTANAASNSVSVISGYNDTVTATVPVGSGPDAITVDPVTGFVYVANRVGNTVSVIDEATNAVTDTLPAGTDPTGVAADAYTYQVYVTNQGSPSLSEIDEATDAVTGAPTGPIAPGSVPSAVAIDPDRGVAYVTDWCTNCATHGSVMVYNLGAAPGQQTISYNTKPPASPAFGSTYTVSATGGGSGNPVTLSIDASATSVCSISGSTVTFNHAGSCIIDANQAGNATYQAAQQAQQAITVPQEAPTLTWAHPANISYGTALTGTELDARASVPGTFTYSPPAGTVLKIGTQTLRATFTPADTTDYTGGTVSTQITVALQLPCHLPAGKAAGGRNLPGICYA
jgi:YVTN family beta-propeller protein